ncbi:MAG: C25 family cysteine peptidase, partial [Ignavibacteria bacterium]|nr:C25 family cysteine peptidase [Ignavibacteria bacterium]
GPYLDTAYTDFKYSVNIFSSDTSTSSFQIGRVPSKNEYEIQNYISKVIIYETDTLYSDWMNKNLFVKQTYPDNQTVQAYNQVADFLLSQYPEHFSNYTYAESDSLPQGVDRDSILSYLNTIGVNSLWLIGHALPAQFSYFSLIDTSDINLIHNEPKYFITFFLAHQRYSFEADKHGLANRFLLDDEASINVIAPVGYTFLMQQESLLGEVSNNLFGAERRTLGDAMNQSRNNLFNSYSTRMLNLWGDPSIFPKYEVTASTGSEEILPLGFELFQNYPNPFNPSTTIKFTLPVSSNVKLTVYNALGQLVETLVDREMQSGYHEVNFDASRLASGVYLYQLQAGEYISIRKMALIK